MNSHLKFKMAIWGCGVIVVNHLLLQYKGIVYIVGN